jgi:hypothetical protein
MTLARLAWEGGWVAVELRAFEAALETSPADAEAAIASCGSRIAGAGEQIAARAEWGE